VVSAPVYLIFIVDYIRKDIAPRICSNDGRKDRYNSAFAINGLRKAMDSGYKILQTLEF
jgi:hypothetical protein